MYYYVCKGKIIKNIKFERTLSPAKGVKNVTANCSENSIPSQNAASFKGYCYPNGSWRISLDDNIECLCVEGYTLNKRDGSCSSCSNTSYKTGISNDDCTECPMNTVSSNVKRASCVCKDGYYKTSSDKSEVSPCYALPEIREKPRTRLIAYGVELSWTAPKNSLNEIILYNVTCFICSQSICNIPCLNETYDPGWNNLRQTLVTVSNLIAGEKYVFRVYVSVKDVVPEGEWRYIETDRVQVTSDSVKETTDCTDDSGIIINYIIIATTVAGVFLSIIIVLLVKYKRLKRALRLLTHVDIPLKAVDTPQESLPIDQEGPGYETVSAVVREFHDDVDTNANNSEDTSADGHYEEVGIPSVGVHKKLGYKTPGQIEAYEEPKMSQENPGYTEFDKNRLQGRNAADDSTYQKLQWRRDSDVTPAHERRESNEDIKMGRNLPGYEELDQSKREADDYTLFTKSGQKPELA
ncbi:ephrin type-A receptor 2-like [Paramuricea clavata]|nr:ephrin type-A receptor 2-like [Paramuricea clavata]